MGKQIAAANRRLVEELPRQKASMTTQRLFANGKAYELSTRHGVNRPTAFGGRVMEITVAPTFVGSKSAYDLAYILTRAITFLLKHVHERG